MNAQPNANLIVQNLTVRFGGVTAVDDLSLTARAGTITGLLGPNGAGKTTTLNACAGAVSAAGAVTLGRTRLDRHSISRRAGLGLGRTFQRMQLWDSMTVAENVALGREAAFAARRPWSQLFEAPGERAQVLRRRDDAIARCGIGHLAGRIAGELSTGQRRLVELARAIASSFRFLLLDEPSSGLDVRETAHFGQVLRDFVDDTGVGILLVEHDMALVADVCSYIYVLDFGELIFEGTTRETMTSDIVRAAYLGSDAVEDALALQPRHATGRVPEVERVV